MSRERVRRLEALSSCCILFLLLSSGCARERGETSADRPGIVVSVEPQAYFVERLAGDRVDITVLIPPGASPTTHEPTIRQIEAVERAALLIQVGHPSFPFERVWLDRLLPANPDVPVVDCAAWVEHLEGDPHLWVAPSTVRAIVPHIAAALIELLPEAREEIEARARAFLSEVAALDMEIRGMLAGIENRRFYVFHPAWGYLAADYDLEQVSIEHGHKEPDPHAVATLIEQARSEGVKVIFVQPQFSQRSAELIADEIDGQVVPLDPLARDWLANLRQVAIALRLALDS